MKSSTGSRSFKLLKLAAKVGTSELAQNIKSRLPGAEKKDSEEGERLRENARLDQAKWIVENLAQLKGAAMKVGQLLSIDSGDYFPPEAMAVLSKLQASAEPVEFAVLRKVLANDLGEKTLGDFDDLNETPDAAASIGQVHRARLGDKEVAIKIQYPGVADSIDSDLRILRGLATTVLSASGRDVDLTSFFQELTRVLKQESNYTEELQLMTEYRQHVLKSQTAENPLYVVPEPISTHSGRRVLTMTWETGSGLEVWLRSRPSIERRERLAHAMLDLFCKEFFDWGLVQTDPNFANFLIGRDHKTGRDTLVLLDFGAAIRYDEQFRNRYRRFLAAMGTLSAAHIIQDGIDFGLISERESDESKQLFADLMKHSIEPFYDKRQPFKFDDDDYAKRTREAGTRFAKSLRFSPPPEQIIFLHRKLGGMFNFVRKLDVNLDLTPYWNKMVGSPPPTS